MSSHEASGIPMNLLLAHAGFVRGLARALVSGDHDVEDLVQETWLAALTSKQSRLLKPRSWLASILRRRAARHHRTHARLADRHGKAARPEAVPSTAELAQRHEQIQSVSRAIEAIPTHYREALVLRYYDGMPPRAVAARLGVPVETARTRIRRGLQRMRAELDAQNDGNRAAWALPLAGFVQAAGSGVSTTALVVTAAALVLLAGGLLVATLSSSDAPRSPRDVGSDAANGAPTLVGRRDPDPAAPTEADRPKPDALDHLPQNHLPQNHVPQNRIRIRGRLSTTDGSRPRGAVVRITHLTSGITEVLAATPPVDPEGRFDVLVPYAPWPVEPDVDPTPSMSVRVIATAEGYRATVERVAARRGGGRTVTLVLKRGAKIEGRIVDEGGRPVEGLVLVASTRRMGRRKIVSVRTFEPDKQDPVERQVDTARAATDADGRFAIHGLAKGPYWLYSASPDWFVVLEDVLPVGARPATHVAVRPFALVGEVRDSRTAEGVDAALWLRVRPEEGAGLDGPIGTSRTVQAAWLLNDPEFAGAMDVTISARAPGYLPFERTIRYEPNERKKRLDVLLVQAGRGTLIVRVLKADGSTCRDEVQVDLRRPAAGGATDMTAPQTADRISPIRIQAPATRWVLCVFPLRSGLLDLTSWTGEVEVHADREEHVDVRLPPYGTLRVRTPGWKLAEMKSFVVDLGRGEQNPSMFFSGPQLELAWPAGTFTIRYEGAQGPVTRTFEVREDEVTDLELAR